MAPVEPDRLRQVTEDARRIETIAGTWPYVVSLIILSGTLCPLPEWPGARQHFFSSLIPANPGAWLDALENVILYVPFGLVCLSSRISARGVILRAFAISLVAELAQFYIPGRDPSARDIATNVLGAVLGAVLAPTQVGGVIRRTLRRVESLVDRALHAERRLSGRLSLVAALFTTLVLTASGWGLSPSLPDGPYIVPGPYIDPESGPLRIGGDGRPSGFFAGLIDDVRVFDNVRSGETITEDMRRAVTAPAAEPGLVAAYNFDEGAGDIAHDASGHAHHGQLRGAQWHAAGRHKGALAFDGNAEVVVSPSRGLVLRDRMTVEAWVCATAEPSLWPAVVEQSNDAYYLYASSDSGRFLGVGGGRFGGSNEDARAGEPLRYQEWTHLAVTYDARIIRLYVDGREVATRPRWSALRPVSATLNGVTLPFGPVADPLAIRKALLGHVTADVVVECSSAKRPDGPLFLISAPPETRVLTLEADGADLVIRPLTRAARLGLPTPDFRVSRALESCRAPSVARLTMTGPLQRLDVAINGVAVSATGVTIGSGWALLIHSELMSKPLRRAASALWLLLLTVPIGFWARMRLSTLMAGFLCAAGLLSLPAGLNVRPLERGEIVAALAGLVAGLLLSLYQARKELPIRPKPSGWSQVAGGE